MDSYDMSTWQGLQEAIRLIRLKQDNYNINSKEWDLLEETIKVLRKKRNDLIHSIGI